MNRLLLTGNYKRLFLPPCVALLAVLLLLLPGAAAAQNPVVKVDINHFGRPEAEVHEPGYTPWTFAGGNTVSKTFGSVTVKFTAASGASLATDWYKAGVQAPYYARLANDGLTSGQVEMRISGLPEGDHTLLSFHNTFANPLNNTFSPVDILLNGALVVDNLMPSNRAASTSEVPTAYLSFTVQAGQDVVVLFKPEMNSTASLKMVTLSGFELNTPNIQHQARLPQPADGDEHADADAKSLTLKWTAAADAVSHDVYFGSDAALLADADRNSGLFRGNQAGTEHQVSGLYSMETYYWRVDEVSAGGTITKGNVWYFRPRQLAFAGAEGYGRYARGGRGGKVVEVTNLNDSGPGSLREAVTNDIGPRTIVFAVSGIIELQSRLVLNQPYVTVAGQTAPGKGITIRKAPFGITGNDAVVRHVRVRLGAGTTFDGMGLTGADHSIIDHSSISWTIDEAFSSRSGKNITLQRTLISEALNVAGHQNYPAGSQHGYAATISGDIGSFHHNLLAHCYGRNWSLGGGLDGNGNYAGRLDIRNNVVYNWGQRTTDGGAHEVNFVNNYYKPGPATTYFYALNAQHESVGTGTQRYYFAGNVMPGRFDESNQSAGRRISGSVSYETFVNQPFFPSYVTTHSAGEAYKQVLSDVGCTQPVFDDHDIRIINETLGGTFTYRGSRSGKAGLPDSHLDVGGYEDYPEIRRPDNWDSDHDGLPDWWETIHGLNLASAPGDFSDTNADPDRDGFTHLDAYLDWLANPHYTTTPGEQLEIDLAQLSRGFTDKPAYTVAGVVNGEVTLLPNSSTARFTPSAQGLASFRFTVTDDAGSSMTRTIGIHATGSVLGLKTEVQPFGVQCYPNPTPGALVLAVYMEKAAPAAITVHNILGSRVLHLEQQYAVAENATRLDVSHLSPGLYFITVSTAGKQQTVKFLKE